MSVRGKNPFPGPMSAGRRVRRSSAQAVTEQVFLDGDRELARPLAEALAAHGEIDRVTQLFHSYPARLHPDAARRILTALPGKSLLDPFCGGGTTLVEGLLDGRRVLGSDLNPIAALVSHARTRVLDAPQLRELEQAVQTVCREAKAILDSPFRPHTPPAVLKLAAWYAKPALLELSALLESTLRQPESVRGMLRALHSSLVVKHSLRASETSNKVVHQPPRPGQVLRAYRHKADEYIGMLAALRREVPEGTCSALVTQGDARVLEAEPCELVLTSPPYPGTYDYILLQQLRLAWLGEPSEHLIAKEIGSRRGISQNEEGMQLWRRDTAAWMGAAVRALLPGGHLVIVVGDGLAGGQLLRAGEATVEMGRALGLTMRASASTVRRDPALKKPKREYIFGFVKERQDGASGSR